MIDVRTKTEKKRDERNKFICESFLKYSKEMPECAPHRIFRMIAERVDMTVPGVKNIIVSKGLYETKKK